MRKPYEMNHIDHIITLSESFMRKAGILNSPEYKELLKLRRDWPDYKLQKASSEKKSKRNKVLKYEVMREYIKSVESTKEEAEKVLEEMEKIRTLSKVQANPYKFVHDWFISRYPECKSAASSNNSDELNDEEQSA